MPKVSQLDHMVEPHASALLRKAEAAWPEGGVTFRFEPGRSHTKVGPDLYLRSDLIGGLPVDPVCRAKAWLRLKDRSRKSKEAA